MTNNKPHDNATHCGLYPANRPTKTSQSIDQLLSFGAFELDDIGSKSWWESIKKDGVPLIQQIDEYHSDVVFLWQRPSSQATNNVQKLHIDIRGITNHHSFELASLTPYKDSDIHYFHCVIPNDWRCTYSFWPIDADHAQPVYSGNESEQKTQHRTWLKSIFDKAIADPLNKNNMTGCAWGVQNSPLSMANAPSQPGWDDLDNNIGRTTPNGVIQGSWQSHLLGNERKYWRYCTEPHPTKDTPIVLILDGDFWAETMPMFTVLEEMTAKGGLQPAVYLFIDSIDPDIRFTELACNEPFWLAILHELLPLLCEQLQLPKYHQNTVVTGQSLGGLSAFYAVATWPERFRSALCQSSSFWWPNQNLMTTPNSNALALSPEFTLLLQNSIPHRHEIKIFMEAGTEEGTLTQLNDMAHTFFDDNHYDIQYRKFSGGHDRYCWRGGLIDGLVHLIGNKEY